MDLEQLDRPMDGFEKEKIMLPAILLFIFLKSEKKCFLKASGKGMLYQKDNFD